MVRLLLAGDPLRYPPPLDPVLMVGLEDLMTHTLAELRKERAVLPVGEWEVQQHENRLTVLESRLDRQLTSYRRIHSTPTATL